jgi:hypothetical protein
MTATPAPRHAHHQHLNTAILLTPTRCHPTTQSHWRTLKHISLSPGPIGDIARAALVLNGHWK